MFCSCALYGFTDEVWINLIFWKLRTAVKTCFVYRRMNFGQKKKKGRNIVKCVVNMFLQFLVKPMRNGRCLSFHH